ncbi:MAG: DUF1684 domain-containing protein [Crocinitomicaceae bacterium]|nr:DUF1684 domain-containing protein [Crocinitomicaceae bacterium]
MKITSILFALLISSVSFGQLSKSEILEKREHHAEKMKDSVNGYLKPEEIAEFEGLDYFDFDSTFQIEAKFFKKKGKKFEMPTSTERRPIYRKYGYIEFTINDSLHTVEVYQNLALRKEKEYKDHLFIPFRDKTSRLETYGGGRYLDVKIPKKKKLLVDFNLAYNPYCAYSHRYSCPIPPEANTLNVRILAGEKTPFGH